ncbi:MAG: ATP-dependent helicase [Anaerolineaceae bacterium]|nr:ATP-dependent helicase [Anaerolineaceae bacterium]
METIAQPTFTPRPSQQIILDTLLNATGPVRLGVSAVPGSGKTHILSYLASELVQRVEDDQEVLIVTLVNAAVDNFRRRVDGFVRAQGLLPGFNYRVCTLHSLAHEIVQQRPSLVGLSQDFGIVDDRTAQYILQEVVDSWLSANLNVIEDYLLPTVQIQPLLRQSLPDLVKSIAQNFIKRAKDLRLAPYQLEDAYRRKRESLPLAQLGLDIYREYQNRLARTGVDFDDLIRLAFQAIELDPDFLARLRKKWPYILEDEAQDSSLLQEQILDALTGPAGTWVRVGDPNQAIYETFTTADPENLRAFLVRDGVISLPMPESGRSSQSIIDLANYLIDWTMSEHPQSSAQSALGPPPIQPTPPGDPQTNPMNRPEAIYFRSEKYRPQQEIQAIIRSVKRWLEKNKDKTVAILDPRNKRGVDVANALRRAEVPYVELLNSTAATRSTAGVLGNVLKHLARPEDARQLSTVFQVWQRHDWDLEDLQPIFQWVEQSLKNCPRVEDYLWPRPGHDWLDQQLQQLAEEHPGWAVEAELAADQPEPVVSTDKELLAVEASEPATAPPNPLVQVEKYLRHFKALLRRWQDAAILPIDQLILVLAQDLFDNPADLALAHKFAVVLRRTASDQPGYRLPQFVEELAEIARNQRRFLGFDEDSVGFEPPQGKVTVSTMHRAKGLEWDRVYLMGLNNYSFPSGLPMDSYFSEKWFVRDSLNLEAEVLAQLAALADQTPYQEGLATEEARLDLVKERLRLLFVGMTRAKQELVVTWNTGQQYPNKPDNQPAAPFVALQTWWEENGGRG